MTRDEFEALPETVQSGKLNWNQGIRQMIVFILKNKPLFGLTRYDDDFISEVIIDFLDRGEAAMAQYLRLNGTFYSYTYCFVKNICNSIIKRKSIKHVIEYHNLYESIINYENKIDSYANIKYSEFERPKVPYNFTPISVNDFQIACKTDSYQIKKIIKSDKSELYKEIMDKLRDFSPLMIQNIILVLALKSSYYITEDQITAITQMFNIDYNKFHQIILKIKTEIVDREENKLQLEMRRNKAYFQHKKLRDQIEFNKNSEEYREYLNPQLKVKYKRSTKNWTVLNHQLEEGKVMIRPTTKLIAKVLGISIRQVTYYQSTARKLGIDLSKV